MRGPGAWVGALPLLLALCGLLVGPRLGAPAVGALLPGSVTAAVPHAVAQGVAGRETDLHDTPAAPGLRGAAPGWAARALPVPAAVPVVASHGCCPPPPPLLARPARPDPVAAALPSSSPTRAPPSSAGT